MGTLAAKVRAKYPGVYDDLGDADLEQRVLAKHPEYSDLASPVARQSPEPSLWEKVQQASTGALSSVGGAISGAAKEAPLVALRSAMMPGNAGSAVVQAALSKLGATDFASRMGEQRNLSQQQMAEPYAAKPEETGAEGFGRTIARTAPSAALAAMTGGASIPAQAAIQGAVSAAQTASEGGSGKDVALSGAGGAVAGAAGPILGKTLGGISSKLEKSAINLYSKALHPTKEATKTISEKIVPELIDRGVYGRLRSIGSLADDQVSALGKEVGAAYDAATKSGVKIDGAKLADALESAKVPFTEVTAAGKVVPLNPGAIGAIEELQGTLRALGDTTPTAIHKFRRVVDDLVSSTNGFTRDLPRGSAREIQKRARTEIQKALNKGVPGIEDLNAEYSFWKNTQKVLYETNRRKTGQQGMVEIAASAIRGGTSFGAVGALAIPLGLGVPGATQVAAVGTLLLPLMRSPVWRTWSAVQKKALAEILAGNAKVLETEVGRSIATTLAMFGVKAGVKPASKESDE